MPKVRVGGGMSITAGTVPDAYLRPGTTEPTSPTSTALRASPRGRSATTGTSRCCRAASQIGRVAGVFDAVAARYDGHLNGHRTTGSSPPALSGTSPALADPDPARSGQ